jgi:hypothetical protein
MTPAVIEGTGYQVPTERAEADGLVDIMKQGQLSSPALARSRSSPLAVLALTAGVVPNIPVPVAH